METSSPERFRQANAIFDAALDLAPAERDAYVETACAGDGELAEAVRRLLRAHDRIDGFLETPAAEIGYPLVEVEGAEPPGPPARIGPFRILRELGRGGMGTVFLAERDDADFTHRVALKLIRGGIDDGYLRRRFLEERRILATLEHRNIARFIDGGVSADGMPYFAMEYVDGVPLTGYCDERRLGLAERLALFADVCDAVRYAHASLVVHRDLKPSNILVTDSGEVKLLDFGIAKLLADGRAPGEPPRAATELHVMTPDYAAPEQIRNAPVTTATDVYALGVILYELLTGERPYAVGGRSAAEVERAICETEPLRPSTALRRMQQRTAGRDRARLVGLARGSTPERLTRRLRGDLDTIVMKALHKEPGRRYASAAALLEDIRRFAAGRPVLARPDTLVYRARKLVARHPLRVGAGLAAAITVIGSASLHTARVTAERDRAEAEARTANAVKEYLVGVFDVADPFGASRDPGDEVTARQLLERGAARVDQLAGEPAVQAELLGVLGRVYTNLGMHVEADSLLSRSLASRRALHGPEHPAVAEAIDDLGVLRLAEGRYDDAEPLLSESLAMRRRLLGGADLATATSLDRLATAFQERNQLDRAEPLFREALEIRTARLDPDDPLVAASLNNLGLLHYWRGDYAEAERYYRPALAAYLATLGEDHPTTARTKQNLAQTVQFLGRLDEAERLARESLAAKRRIVGDLHPTVTIGLNNLARLLVDLGKFDEAESFAREALALDRRMFGEEHPFVAASMDHLGTVLRNRGSFEEAAALFRQALAMNRKLRGEDHVSVPLNLNNIGNVLYQQGELDGAERYYRESLESFRRIQGREHWNALTLAVNLARVLRERGRYAEAGPLLEGVIAIVEPKLPFGRLQYIGAHVGLGEVRLAAGDTAAALERLGKAVELSDAYLDAADWRRAEAQLAFGAALLAAGRRTEAEPLIRQGHQALQSQRRQQPRLAARAEAVLAALER